MKNSISIQIKAAFLVIVFSLNTIIGFACAIGINMGFNSTHHHHDEEATEMSEHHTGAKFHHHDEDSENPKEASMQQHSSNNEKDNCCNHTVIQFNEIDKSANHSFNTGIKAVYV